MRRVVSRFRFAMESIVPSAETRVAPGAARLPYSADDIVRLREAFAPLAKRYRRQRRLMLPAIVVGLCSLALLGPRYGHPWLGPPWHSCALGLLLACVVVAVIAGFARPRLICPGCGAALDKGFVHYCPECGSQRLSPGRDGSMKCEDCGGAMRHGRGGQRHWTVRACTTCGLALDDEGVKI